MSWSDDEDLFDNGKSKKIHRKPRKDLGHIEEDSAAEDEEDSEYKRKRAGKRSHRKKTHKDEFWGGGDHR